MVIYSITEDTTLQVLVYYWVLIRLLLDKG